MPTLRELQEPVGTTGTLTPSESDIAVVAFQLWLDNGCRLGSDQEDWFRAEAMLKHAFAAAWKAAPRPLALPDPVVPTQPQTRAALCWEGHWEVWAMEWGEARWIEEWAGQHTP